MNSDKEGIEFDRDTVQDEIIDFVNEQASDDDLREIYNLIWPPDDETE